jgi:hypothetical protein
VSDQGKWAKIWISTLANPDLENLELHNWARWVRLILFMKAHGTNGKLSFSPPFRALQNVMRVATFEELIALITNLPNFKVLQPLPNASHTPLQEDSGKYMLTCRNWFKFQGDMSTERVKKFRQKQSVTSTVTSNGESNGLRREEKRRITSTSTSLDSTSTSRSRPAPLPGASATRETDGHQEALQMNIDYEAMEMAERNREWKRDTKENLPKSEMATPQEVKAIMDQWRKDNPRGGKH